MKVNIDISNCFLKTERLILRPWKNSDLDDLYEYAKVDGVGQMAGWMPHKSKEESSKILSMFIEGKETFALEYNGKVIGSIGIEQYDEDVIREFINKKGREIGYVLSKEYWGMGLMPEAVKAVIDYCFNEVGLDLLICCHFIDNNQSKRVQEKCGFKHYKFIEKDNKYGSIHDKWLSILERK